MAYSDINNFIDCYLVYENNKYKVTGIHSSNYDFINIFSFARVFQIPKDEVVLQHFTGMVDSYGEKIYQTNQVFVGDVKYIAVKSANGYYLQNRNHQLSPLELMSLIDKRVEVRVIDND